MQEPASKAGGTHPPIFNPVVCDPRTPQAVGKPTATPAIAGARRPALGPAGLDLKVHSGTHYRTPFATDAVA